MPWNPQGRPAQQVAKSLENLSGSAPSAAPPGAIAGGAPPPPPPPPGPAPVLEFKPRADPSAAVPAGGSSNGLGAVFSEINKGESVTKGLRKVDKTQMTHKNPSLRASAPTVASDSDSSSRAKGPPGKKPKPETLRVKKPPRKILEGNKWTIVGIPTSDPAPLRPLSRVSTSCFGLGLECN